METTALSLVKGKNKDKLKLIPEQRTYYRLQKKIESLQKNQKRLIQDLDKALQFYYGNIYPKEDKLANMLMERSRIAYQFYQKVNKFSRKERKIIKRWIQDDLEQILHIVDFASLPDELKKIFKDLNGARYEQIASGERNFVKDDFQEMFKEMGLDIDLSEINLDDTQEELFQKASNSFCEAASNSTQEQKKTKQQLEKELKQRQAREIQKRSLRAIYTQLAKVFHPDLEPDSEKKVQKEELMKKLTAAYEKNDLYALLALELEWLTGSSASAAKSYSREQLKIYNEVLNDQVNILQMDMQFPLRSPKYYSLQRFYPHSFDGIAVLEMASENFSLALEDLRLLIERLRSCEAESFLKRMIQEELFKPR